MNWKERIEFSMRILDEAARIMSDKDFSQPGSNAVEDLVEQSNALRQYLEDSDLDSCPAKQRKMESVCIFRDVIETVFPRMFEIDERSRNVLPQYLTFEEAYEKLMAEYSEAAAIGSSEIGSMSVDEWLKERGIVVVSEEDRMMLEK